MLLWRGTLFRSIASTFRLQLIRAFQKLQRLVETIKIISPYNSKIKLHRHWKCWHPFRSGFMNGRALTLIYFWFRENAFYPNKCRKWFCFGNNALATIRELSLNCYCLKSLDWSSLVEVLGKHKIEKVEVALNQEVGSLGTGVPSQTGVIEHMIHGALTGCVHSLGTNSAGLASVTRYIHVKYLFATQCYQIIAVINSFKLKWAVYIVKIFTVNILHTNNWAVSGYENELPTEMVW